MERFTIEKCGDLLVKNGDKEFRSPCFGCENIDFCKPEKDMTCDLYKAILKLKEYEDLEEQGLLIRLPCKVGDTVYEVQQLRKRIQPYKIVSIYISRCSVLFGWEIKDGKGIYSNVNGFCDYAIGKTVFLTKAEADEASQRNTGHKNGGKKKWTD